MRIAFLSPVGVIGGAERILLSILKALRQVAPEWQLQLVVLDEGPLLAEAAALGVETIVCPLPARLARTGDSRGVTSALWHSIAAAPAMGIFVSRLRRVLRALAPDLIHSNGIKTHLLARCARPANCPVIWHVHDFYGRRPLARRLLRSSRSGVRCAIAVSDAVKQDLNATIPGLAVDVVRNTVDVARFKPGRGDSAALDRLAGLPPAEGVIRVGLVATYARWKGQDVFLRAAANVLKDPGIPCRFYIIGGPIYRTAAQFTVEELSHLADSLGLNGMVAFVPFQSEPADVYRALDIVVHASTQPEPFGLTIAEAMACGRAVIASNAGGAAELFRDGHDAIGVSPGDATALAAAIRMLAADPELRSRLGSAARCTAEREFGPERLGAAILDVYVRAGVTSRS